MGTARLTVNLAKITENARKTVEICRRFGVEVVGVTKSACGCARVANAMVDGGGETLGDSRLDNIARMREAGVRAKMMLIRSPAPSEVADCVALADGSLNVDIGVLRALSADAQRMSRKHEVILMVDLDTGREGIPPEDLAIFCCDVAGMKGLALRGVGAYFGFQSEAGIHEAGLRRLVALARETEKQAGVALPVISGGSTNVFRTLPLAGRTVEGVNQLRIGTAILLGIASSAGPVRIEGFHHDTFVLDAEISEIKRGDRRLAILSLGALDAEPAHLFPITPHVSVISATNDHTIVDVTNVSPPLRVGDRVSFELGYRAMNRLMISPYVRVEYH
jgi:predicted amino acid racemase